MTSSVTVIVVYESRLEKKTELGVVVHSCNTAVGRQNSCEFKVSQGSRARLCLGRKVEGEREKEERREGEQREEGEERKENIRDLLALSISIYFHGILKSSC